MKRSLFYKLTFLLLIGTCVVASCESLDDSITEDPYGGGKQPLGISLSQEASIPSSGYPGDTVVFKAKGLLKYCNPENDEYQFKLYLGGMETPIYAATDTTLTVIVPENLSTGTTYLVLQNQVFYGPTFTVLGNVSVDKNYALYNGSTNIDGTIYDYVENKNSNSAHNFYLVGNFSAYINNSNNFSGICYVDNRGNLAQKNTSNFGIDKGCVTTLTGGYTSSPYIRSISYFEDGRMLVSGSFDAYYTNNPRNSLVATNYLSVNNMLVLQKDAFPDTLNCNFDELLDNSGKYTQIGLARFNGGTKQTVIRSFVTSDQKVIAVGNITQYVRMKYASYYEESEEEVSSVASVLRMSDTGDLDTTYRQGAIYTGAMGGSIADACQDGNDGILLVGSFTSFDGQAAHGIVRLDNNGNVDKSFLDKVGTGANGNVSMIRYNPVLKKAMIVGGFTSYNGEERQNIAMLNEDGSLDGNFVPREFGTGSPNFATVLDKEKVVVSGTFQTYDNISRRGFLILDMDGKATQRFNVPGTFSGQLQQVIETENTLGDYGLLLLGNFNRFNGAAAENILMLTADLDN